MIFLNISKIRLSCCSCWSASKSTTYLSFLRRVLIPLIFFSNPQRYFFMSWGNFPNNCILNLSSDESWSVKRRSIYYLKSELLFIYSYQFVWPRLGLLLTVNKYSGELILWALSLLVRFKLFDIYTIVVSSLCSPSC